MKIAKPNIADIVRGLIISAVFIFFSFQSFSVFEYIEKILYSVEMRFALTEPAGIEKIAIVNIDKKSINQLGPWPWPRSLIAEMIGILKDNGARFIGLDLQGLDNREHNQGLSEIKKLYDELEKTGIYQEGKNIWLKKRLLGIENSLDNDKILINVIKKSGNIILPVIGRNDESEAILNEDSMSVINKAKLHDIKTNPNDFYSVNNLIMPFPALAENCFGIGHINQSLDRTLPGRRHLLFINFRGNIIPSMALRLALEYKGEKDKDLRINKDGIQLSSFHIPATKGEVLIKFKGGRGSYPYYSFADILKVKKIPAIFDNKIVLIGRTANGGSTIDTPVDPAMPSAEFIANVLDDLLNKGFIKRPYIMTYLEAAILFLLIMSFSIIFPKTTQTNRIYITIGLCLLIILGGVISFIVFDTWFKTVYIFTAVIVLYLTTSIRDLIASQKMIGIRSEEFMESNRMLGLSFQSQGLLDLAFEKFRKCDLDSSMKDVIYNLGLDYERKRMINKAISVYEYIAEKDNKFRDLIVRIPKLREAIGARTVPQGKGKKEDKILVVDDLEIKPTVGRYEIVREIGLGAMGIVYEARDPKINRRIAIKTIRFSDEFEENRVKEVKNRFFREAEIAGKLSHPSIVSIYDAGDDYDLTYLAMEYLEGSDLRDFCQQEALQPLRKVLYIVSEVAMALNYAHSQGVIHRDIKPGNIMLLKNGKIKVTDFGIAKAISSTETKSGIVLGTPNYMSPEQINGQAIDGRSDLFSLGVVMFELLAGQVPFHGKNITNLLYQITQGKHPSVREINPKVPKVCEQIINKALEKKPEDRFQKGEEMAKYLIATIKKMDEAGKKLRT